MKALNLLTVSFLVLFHAAWVSDSYPQDSTNAPVEFNTEYKASIGSKVYTKKTEGTAIKKIEGTISGIKKNRDNTLYMLIEFRETPLPGSPVFSDNTVIGMVYRQSTAGELFEAMPVKVVLDFLRSLNMPVSYSKSSISKVPPDEKISAVKEYIDSREYEKAIKILNDSLEKEPGNAELHGWKGVALMEMGNPRDAVIEFRKAISIEPENADFHNGLGYSLLESENMEEAVIAFKEAIRLNPKLADARYGIGTAYISLGNTKLATKEYTILKDLDSRMADSLFKLIIRRGSLETE